MYKHHLLTREKPLTRGFDDFFKVPHSRNTTVALDSIWNCPELIVLAKSYEAGAYLIQNHSGSQIFITGHPEYDRMTLDKEYHRDLDAGLNPQIPENYYLDNNPENPPGTHLARSCQYAVHQLAELLCISGDALHPLMHKNGRNSALPCQSRGAISSVGIKI